jgi:hypothetical protein
MKTASGIISPAAVSPFSCPLPAFSFRQALAGELAAQDGLPVRCVAAEAPGVPLPDGSAAEQQADGRSARAVRPDDCSVEPDGPAVPPGDCSAPVDFVADSLPDAGPAAEPARAGCSVEKLDAHSAQADFPDDKPVHSRDDPSVDSAHFPDDSWAGSRLEHCLGDSSADSPARFQAGWPEPP